MALGRGLGALIPKTTILDDDESLYQNVSIDRLKPNEDQPRSKFDDLKLQELADSIVNRGIIEPIIVKSENDDLIIIAGERRWRAAQLAGLDEVPVVINQNLDSHDILEIALIENIQREDLNIVELAMAYDQLIEKHGYTQDQLSNKLGVSRSSLTNTLRILKLPELIRNMLLKNELSFGAAKALMSLDNEEMQLEVAANIKDNDLSVRETEKLIRSLKQPVKKEKEEDPYLKDLENTISQRFDTKVKIKKGKKSGKIEIAFVSEDHLNSILNAIGINGGNL